MFGKCFISLSGKKLLFSDVSEGISGGWSSTKKCIFPTLNFSKSGFSGFRVFENGKNMCSPMAGANSRSRNNKTG